MVCQFRLVLCSKRYYIDELLIDRLLDHTY